MDLCIKTEALFLVQKLNYHVSILVLMDLCIKTFSAKPKILYVCVSILVLMDLCIKTFLQYKKWLHLSSFNPCFNGSMYKNNRGVCYRFPIPCVSILVLMDLCIKTISDFPLTPVTQMVSILVLMDLCIKTAFA